jgi:hypothetical protein
MAQTSLNPMTEHEREDWFRGMALEIDNLRQWAESERLRLARENARQHRMRDALSGIFEERRRR